MNDKILMPTELTAENGAKYLLNGEFKQTCYETCPVCCGDGLIDDEEICGFCEGQGVLSFDVCISWHTIKEIYKKAAKHLGTPCKAASKKQSKTSLA